MEIDIISKKENKVLDRTEVKFDCIYNGEATPKILAVKSKLIALLNTKKDLIVIDSLQPRYGETKADGYAKIYDSRDNLEAIETEHVISKNIETKEKVADEESETTAKSEEVEESDAIEDSEDVEEKDDSENTEDSEDVEEEEDSEKSED
jgi:small subunit ribosomal protein S24e